MGLSFFFFFFFFFLQRQRSVTNHPSRRGLRENWMTEWLQVGVPFLHSFSSPSSTGGLPFLTNGKHCVLIQRKMSGIGRGIAPSWPGRGGSSLPTFPPEAAAPRDHARKGEAERVRRFRHQGPTGCRPLPSFTRLVLRVQSEFGEARNLSQQRATRGPSYTISPFPSPGAGDTAMKFKARAFLIAVRAAALFFLVREKVAITVREGGRTGRWKQWVGWVRHKSGHGSSFPLFFPPPFFFFFPLEKRGITVNAVSPGGSRTAC